METQTLILPRAEDLLKKTWEIYKANLRTFLGIMTLPILDGFFILILTGILLLILALLILFFLLLSPL